MTIDRTFFPIACYASQKITFFYSNQPMQVYAYPPLQEGKLLRRYKRFFAEIILDSGEVIIAHCPNTGPMTGVSTPESRVYVSQSNNPQRKLAYTWEMVEVDGTWVGINTGLPNRVIGLMLAQHYLPELEPYQSCQPEVAYGKERSRIDFLLADPAPDRYVEIKNTTWSQGSTALFPDSVTTRGQKHLRELITIVAGGQQASLIYFINRGDCHRFAPGDQADPKYGTLLRSAIGAGVQILPYRFEVTPQGIGYLGLAELTLQ